MSKKQVILFCNYTSTNTRAHLHLSNMRLDNCVRKRLGIPELRYIDAAPWIEAFISFFQGEVGYHLHIVALQMGMKCEYESFEDNGVTFHYVKSGLSFWSKLSDKLYDTQKKKDYPIYQRRFEKALRGLKPDILLLCGAENPDYATPFLKNECPQKIVIMQTLMNDEKRIQMGVSNDFRREIENRVLMHAQYFAVPDVGWIKYVRHVNPEAVCFPFTFPTIKPLVSKPSEIKYDFVFFAGILGRNKGTNDLLSAMTVVCKTHPDTTLNIIGSANEEYMLGLHQQVVENALEANVLFTPPFPRREDVFHEVYKAKVAVLPGITASLNSTVREAMLMGMPTIVYETPDTKIINKDSVCLITAEMENINDLAAKMCYAINCPVEVSRIACDAEEYANKHFSQEAFNASFREIIRAIDY